MNNFKVGDKVRFHQKTQYPESLNKVIEEMPDRTGVINRIDPDGDIWLNGWAFKPEDLTLITEEYLGEPTQSTAPLSTTTIRHQTFYLSNTKPKGNKIMSIISNTFKSKENKALEYFNLGTTEKLNEQGQKEFVDFIFETGSTDRKEFFKKIVEAYKESKK